MSYPYTLKPVSLRDFLKKIPTIGVPTKVTTRSIVDLGFKSTRDRPIVKILKFIGFLDNSGKPTANYLNFRSKAKSKVIMAKCLKSAYSELFSLYPDAHKRTNEELENFFSPRLTGGEAVIKNTVSTFKALTEFADFEAGSIIPETEAEESKKKIVDVRRVTAETPSGVTINLNIQLTLPEVEDATVYDKIFKALKDNLLSRD